MALKRQTFFAAVKSGVIFQKIKSGELPHPTSTNFDISKWQAAINNKEDNSRDTDLLNSAIFFHTQIITLRNAIKERLAAIKSESDRRSISSAVPNFLLNSILMKTSEAFKAANAGRDSIYGGDEGNVFITNTFGQSINADDGIAILADSIPYFYFHTKTANDRLTTDLTNFVLKGPEFSSLTSIEKGLRDLWQQVLWEGHSFSAGTDKLKFAPSNRELSEYWLAWRRRFETMALQTTNAETGAQMLTDGARTFEILPPWSVTSFDKKNGRKPHFTISRRKHHSAVYKPMINAVKDTYLSAFSEPIYNNNDVKIDINDLAISWAILLDCYNVITKRIKKGNLDSSNKIKQWSVTIPIESLILAFNACGNWDSKKSIAIISIFTADIDDRSKLFNKGLWGSPIIRNKNEQSLKIVGAVLVSANPILTIERWMEKVGFTEKSKDRGLLFEKFVRNQIAQAANSNPLKPEFRVSHLNSQGKNSEEIDAIFVLGKRIFIAEIKCFNTPYESIERYNHLKKVEEAASQAKRKSSWVKSNPDTVKSLFGDIPGIFDTDPTPMVILNTPHCSGAEIDGCIITDFRWAEIVLSMNEIITGARFERGSSVQFQKSTLYNDLSQLESNFEKILENIPAIKTEIDRIEWRGIDFPTSTGSTFEILTPMSVGVPNFSTGASQ